MRKLATFLLVSGVAVITYGITRWLSFKEFVTPDLTSGEGDPRFFTACQHMLAAVISGLIIICVSGYFFGRAKEKKS